LATAFTLNELTGPLSDRDGGRDPTIERFRALPADRYGRLVEVATAARDGDPGAELHSGLQAQLTGLCSRTSTLRAASPNISTTSAQ
jgi:hypothetical protein